MLQLKAVYKSYTTNDFTQVALDGVSLAFRDNEFVSVLGPSGSGKTTLLNVIGGLDHFDDGDLLIDGISTREYRDRDWDTYRNNRIGFVFQSYNLIPHQTILANVELALTLSGVSPAERRERARVALEEVGLGDHVDKRPSQLSGGQMQRVAIARALINDPEILLADEPTGALDSKTSVQVMDLLREVASDRLVIMVTHNPDLAHEYSTRIVELADGKIRSDTDPFVPTEADQRPARPSRRTSMSFLTALSLSFNNLMTKKGRTLMTAFAGSIGIIGIAAILALATGVNAYIQEVEEKTLSAYPLQIMSSGFDMTAMLVDMSTDLAGTSGKDGEVEGDPAQGQVHEIRMVNSILGGMGKNDLQSLKEFIDADGGGISSYVQDIEYKYGLVPQIFANDSESVNQVNPDDSFSALGFGGSSSSMLMSSSAFSTNAFSELPANLGLVEQQYDVKAGRWPKDYNELVLVLSKSGSMADFISYAMGLRDNKELKEMIQQFADQEEITAPNDSRTYTYDQVMDVSFRVVPAVDFYVYESDFNVWASKQKDKDYMRQLLKDAEVLKIVGVVQPKENVDATSLSQGIYYSQQLTLWLMQKAAASKIVQDQLNNPTINVISGKSFAQEAEEQSNDFDMSSLFSIDQDKLTNAFGMDMDKLDFSGLDLSDLGNAMDFSNMDLSSMMGSLDLSSMSLPELDLSAWDSWAPGDTWNMDLGLAAFALQGIDLNGLMDPELMRAMMPSLVRLNPVQVFAGVRPIVNSERLSQAVATIQQGLRAYMAAHPEELADPDSASRVISNYFSQPEVAQQLSSVMSETVTISDEDKQLIANNIRSQIVGFEDRVSPERLQQLGEGTTRLADALASQLGNQFANLLGSQLAAQLGKVLSVSLGTITESFFSQAMGSFMTGLGQAMQEQLGTAVVQSLQGSMSQLMSGMGDAFHIDEQAFAEAFSFNMDQNELGQLLLAMMSVERTSYENNLSKLGYAEVAKPTEIDLYPSNFDDKAEVVQILEGYNDNMRQAGEEDKTITYTDIVGALMTSVTSIVNMISYVLIAFVAISLIVSSIMIGVITYISVLERKKEIGILRSIGASKRDVSNVFNAETVIEGLVSGLMGVGITVLATIPANIIVEANFGVHRVARLPISAALILVGVSVVLSFVAGVIPARKASKADPVEALRSE